MKSIELKGFKSLLNVDNFINDIESVNSDKDGISSISINLLRPGKYQPRTSMDQVALDELASSIKANGIIQPLIVRHHENEGYEIIAGERRWQAAKLVGLFSIPAIIRDVSNETALAFALIENIQRESLNPIDEATSLSKLQQEFSMTHEQIAERVGKSRSTISNLIRLLSLCEEIKGHLRTKKIEMGHARALLSLDTGLRLEAASIIIKNKLSVRNTEKLVKKFNTVPIKKVLPKNYGLNKKMEAWINALPTNISRKINLSINPHGKGKIILNFSNEDEADWLIEHLKFKI